MKAYSLILVRPWILLIMNGHVWKFWFIQVLPHWKKTICLDSINLWGGLFSTLFHLSIMQRVEWPRGLGPTLFFIFINNLLNKSGSVQFAKPCLYTDYISFIVRFYCKISQNTNIHRIKVVVKTNFLHFQITNITSSALSFLLNETPIHPIITKFLGLLLDGRLNFYLHIDN